MDVPVGGDPSAFLALFGHEQWDDRPESDETLAIRMESPMRNPWTEEARLRYYSDEDVIQMSTGSFVRPEGDLAAAIGATGLRGADESAMSRVLLAGAAFTTVLASVAVAGAIWLSRRRVDSARDSATMPTGPGA